MTRGVESHICLSLLSKGVFNFDKHPHTQELSRIRGAGSAGVFKSHFWALDDRATVICWVFF